MKAVRITIILFVLFISFKLQAQEVEPNGSFITADTIEVNNTISATINPVGDDDYFKFNIPEPGVIVLDVITVPGNIDLNGVIANPDQQNIRTNYDANDGVGYTLIVSTCEIGFHYVKFEDGGIGGNDTSETPYTFSIDYFPFSESDPYECNNESINQAKPIVIGDTIGALIAPWFGDYLEDKDKDYYKFNVSEPGMIRLKMINVPPNMFLDYYIYNNSQIEIKNYYYSNDLGINKWISTCETGDHYLYFKAHSNGDYSYQDQYEFAIDFFPFSEYDSLECSNDNFSTASEIYLCNPVSAVIAPWFDDHVTQSDQIRDIDHYKMYLESGQEYCFSLNPVPTEMQSIGVGIFDQDQVISDLLFGNSGNTIDYTFIAEETGYHYFRVGGGTDYSPLEQYTLEVCCMQVGISEQDEMAESISVFPNPVSEELTIEISNLQRQVVDIIVYDLLGKQLFSTQLNSNTDLGLDTSSWPNGVLFVYFQMDGSQHVKRLIKN